MTLLSTTSDPVLICQNVYVDYRLYSVRVNTLKEYILTTLRRRQKSMVNHALKGVSLTAKRGECIALIGHNGCGKSTFLKVMAGILRPVKGRVSSVGRVAPLIELGAGFDPELTGRENVYLACSLMGLTRREIDQKMGWIREFAELGEFFDAPVKTYSSGMYMRLGFSCSMAIDADLLLIDEILAVGDENYQRKCLSKMNATRNSGTTIVLVSHDLNVVQRMADRVLVLDHGALVYEGAPQPAIQFYHMLMEKRRVNANHADIVQEHERRQRLSANDATYRGNSRVTNVVLRGPGELEPNVLVSDAPWTLEVEFELHEDHKDNVCIGFAIHNEQNQRLSGTNTNVGMKLGRGTNHDALRVKGHHKVVFDFATLPLASGSYKLIVAIHDHNLVQTIDLITDQHTFKVINNLDQNNFDKDQLSLLGLMKNAEVLAHIGPLRAN